MAGANPYQNYLSVQFETADQGTLILMTYDAALRLCRAAEQSLAQNDRIAKGDWLGKAFEVVGELRRSLRPGSGGEVARQLDEAYAFVGRQITLANVTSKREYVENAIIVLEQLRDAWRRIVRESRQQTAAVTA